MSDNERFDAIIIGAGVIGGAIGFELAKRSYRTINIDKLPAAGFGSTSNSCAIVRAHYSTYDGVADAGDAAIDEAARLQGRLVGASEKEVAAAVVAARAALRHPLLRRAAGATALRREAPVLLAMEDGTLAEGVVDLAFREDGCSARQG